MPPPKRPVSDTIFPSANLLEKWYLIPMIALAGCATSNALMVVNVPVSDLRAQPHTSPQSGHDPAEETQLLYG